MSPIISIILTTYNRPQLLQRAIDSVLAQTFKDWELIIVDDHSDIKPPITLPDGEDRVIPIRLPWNTGFHIRPKNVGIMCSHGKYIAYLEDDNVYLPNHLEVLYEAIKNNKADVVYGDRIYKSTIPNEKRFMGKMSFDYDLKRINQGNYVDTSDIMHTIQAINDVGYWDIFWERKPDWLLMTRFGKAGMRIKHAPETITEYWWHNDPQGNIGTPLK
jgi:glycosyltransferase involved in cell wall biosynthesis